MQEGGDRRCRGCPALQVDCVQEVELCREHQITGFPSIRVFRAGARCKPCISAGLWTAGAGSLKQHARGALVYFTCCACMVGW